MWYVLLCLFGFVEFQTDWMGGQAVLGPVTDWGTQYYVSDSVTAATQGQVSLVANQWNYSNWVKHVVESNSGISSGAQGFMSSDIEGNPADIDGDGIPDLVAHTADSVVWYRNDGNYGFAKHMIGPADDAGGNPCVYPCDIDGDDDVDVLVATKGVGAGWYENQSLNWVYHNLDNSEGYHRVSAIDVDIDGDMDIIAVDNSSDGNIQGDIYLFRNDGFENFVKELVADLPLKEGWRVYPADFNGDGYPDIYSICYNSNYVFLNDGTGHFTQSWHGDFWTGNDFDGAWALDVDMDGDVDLVCGGQYNLPHAFYALLNDSTGTNFTLELLQGTEYSSGTYGTYTDGGIHGDIDLDGCPDIAGALFKVGFFRQDLLNPLTFTLYNIEDVDNSHWIYIDKLGTRCVPTIDLMLTERGRHTVYENQMLLGFANLGSFESSVLEIARGCSLRYFGYEACVPYDTALAFYWRDGMNLPDVLGKSWSGPEYGSIGMVVTDSFAVGPKSACMFQYKVEFRNGPDDIAVLYEVWLTYDCPGSGTEEDCEESTGTSVLQYVDGNLVLSLPYDQAVRLTVYNSAGRLTKDVFRGKLPGGSHTFAISAKAGIYFARIESVAKKESFKFTVLK